MLATPVPRVVACLRDGATLSDLASRFAVRATRGRRHPSLVLLKYNQIESPFAEPVVRECRGLILDEADGWRVVSRSFDKFFNHGEGLADGIDWPTAAVQEKLDGSLCVLYSYEGSWHVQTSGTPDASGNVGDDGRTFAELFWQVFRDRGYALPGDDARDLCFSFELMSRWNRVVVQHGEPRLVLIGIRDRRTGAELPPSGGAAPAGWEVVRSFPLGSIDEVLGTFATMEPLRQEGYVVVDGAFRRVKVKHPGYVALHHMRDGLSTRRMLEVLQAGESAELVTYFPEWEAELVRVRGALEGLTAELEAAYARLRDLTSQKDFALEAVRTRCSAALFAVRAGKAPSVRAFLSRMSSDVLLRTLRLEEIAAPAAS